MDLGRPSALPGCPQLCRKPARGKALANERRCFRPERAFTMATVPEAMTGAPVTAMPPRERCVASGKVIAATAWGLATHDGGEIGVMVWSNRFSTNSRHGAGFSPLRTPFAFGRINYALDPSTQRSCLGFSFQIGCRAARTPAVSIWSTGSVRNASAYAALFFSIAEALGQLPGDLIGKPGEHRDVFAVASLRSGSTPHRANPRPARAFSRAPTRPDFRVAAQAHFAWPAPRQEAQNPFLSAARREGQLEGHLSHPGK